MLVMGEQADCMARLRFLGKMFQNHDFVGNNIELTGPECLSDDSGPGGARVPDWPIRPCVLVLRILYWHALQEWIETQ